MKIIELDLTVRTYNCLRSAGITTVEELISMTDDDLRLIKNISSKCIIEIKEVIECTDCKRNN